MEKLKKFTSAIRSTKQQMSSTTTEEESNGGNRYDFMLYLFFICREQGCICVLVVKFVVHSTVASTVLLHLFLYHCFTLVFFVVIYNCIHSVENYHGQVLEQDERDVDPEKEKRDLQTWFVGTLRSTSVGTYCTV